MKTVTGFRCSPSSLVQMQSQNTDLCVLGGGVTSSPACSLVLDNQMTHDGELILQLERAGILSHGPSYVA